MFTSFTPAVSKTALKSMRTKTRAYNWRNRTEISLQDIAKIYNPVIQGWINYYGRYNRSALYPMCRHFNMTLISWARRKYKLLCRHKTKASQFIEKVWANNPTLFAHWRCGMKGAFA